VPESFQRVSEVDDGLKFYIFESAKWRDIVVRPEACGTGRRQKKRRIQSPTEHKALFPVGSGINHFIEY